MSASHGIGLFVIVHWTIVTLLVLRILLKPHRDPSARIAWIVVVLGLPVVGILAYLFLGETSIGRKNAEKVRRVRNALPRMAPIGGFAEAAREAAVDERHRPIFAIGESISEFPPVTGNTAQLTGGSDAAIEEMVRDIDAATRHVHLLFYIWLPDGNGTRMAQALMRAARRGVVCRAMVDDIGSRALVRSPLWREMAEAGVRLATALPVGNPILRTISLSGRVDLRNHRKILVIDNAVTYCGSQNCADPAFLPKAKYAPWVDIMVRLEGPIVRQNQYLFASDWMAFTEENLHDILLEPLPAHGAGFVAQVVATGPTERHSAMPEMFETLIYAAHHFLFITTPYYVPDSSIQAALCSAARRGVDTTIIFPARNDNFAVGATSRSYYAELLEAGVKIFEYEAGLLHTKTLTYDREVTLIGSANMDRRSFDLNYENNILIVDEDVTVAVRGRQESYLADARPIAAAEVAAWSRPRRLWHNVMGLVGPVL